VGAKLDDRGRRSVEAMAHAIVNKLLHGPTTRLKEAAASGDGALPGAVAELFGIEADAAAAPGAPADRREGSERREGERREGERRGTSTPSAASNE
jgi:glutamyl-tRNA reductase